MLDLHSTKESDVSLNDQPALGFMQSKLRGLNLTKPKLMSQEYSSQKKINEPKPPQFFKLLMPRGETASSAVIDYDFEEANEPMKPQVETPISENVPDVGLPTQEEKIPAIVVASSSPKRALIISRGKSRTLEASGLLQLGSSAKNDFTPLKKQVKLPFFNQIQHQESDNSALKSSGISCKSQKSILKQSKTPKSSLMKKDRSNVITPPKDLQEDSSLLELHPQSTLKRVSFAKTNILYLYNTTNANDWRSSS